MDQRRGKEMRIVEKPWGKEIWWAHADGKYMGKTLHIKQGHRLSLQYHVEKDETICVLEGKLKLIHGDLRGFNEVLMARRDIVHEEVLREGQSFRIRPMTVHRFCADYGDVVLLEVSTDHPDDVVRLKDDYSRG